MRRDASGLASARSGRWSMLWPPTMTASKIHRAIRFGDRIRTELQAKGGDGRLSPLPRSVSLVSRFDRPTRLMKEGRAPSQHSPMEEGASPLLQTASPWGKGTVPSSLSPNPYPLSLSRWPSLGISGIVRKARDSVACPRFRNLTAVKSWLGGGNLPVERHRAISQQT